MNQQVKTVSVTANKKQNKTKVQKLEIICLLMNKHIVTYKLNKEIKPESDQASGSRYRNLGGQKNFQQFEISKTRGVGNCK